MLPLTDAEKADAVRRLLVMARHCFRDIPEPQARSRRYGISRSAFAGSLRNIPEPQGRSPPVGRDRLAVSRSKARALTSSNADRRRLGTSDRGNAGQLSSEVLGPETHTTRKLSIAATKAGLFEDRSNEAACVGLRGMSEPRLQRRSDARAVGHAGAETPFQKSQSAVETLDSGSHQAAFARTVSKAQKTDTADRRCDLRLVRMQTHPLRPQLLRQ